jgi:hypothetical protein
LSRTRLTEGLIGARRRREAAHLQGDDQPPSRVHWRPGGPTETVDEIAKLGELHDKGLLTDEEFQAQKQKLLARL